MRVKVILNPWANRGRALAFREQIMDRARPLGDLAVVLTEGPGHAVRLAEAAAREGYDVVAAAGGDGTVHEVVNGLMAADAGVVLGLVPIGTGNDLAYALGMTGGLEMAVSRLFSGAYRHIDLGRIEADQGPGRFFVNGAGIGLDALVAIEVRRIRRLQGFPLYLAAALRTILFNYYSPLMTLHFDKEVVTQPVLMLAVGSGPRAGGGFLLTPHATVDDGLLDSCTAVPMSRSRMLRMMVQAMTGSHIHSPSVTMRRNQCLEIASLQSLPIHCDGEIFVYPEDNIRHVKISCLPGALRVAT